METQSSSTFFLTEGTFQERTLHLKNLEYQEQWAQGLLLGDEWANTLTHGVGFILSLFGFVLLLATPFYENNHWKLVSFAVYGGSLILLYGASTFYHSLRRPKLKKIFRTIDHCAIFVLIAGSYTPFTMLVLGGAWGWTLFIIVWTLAILGIFLKIFFKNRFNILSTSLYLLMGWLVVVAVEPLIERLHINGLYWLMAGGFSYTIGVIFYTLDKRKFFHAIWHLFVLAGSTFHYLAIWLYL